jgi:hypothetical protein
MASGPGVAPKVVETEDLKLAVDEHVRYIQGLDTVSEDLLHDREASALLFLLNNKYSKCRTRTFMCFPCSPTTHHLSPVSTIVIVDPVD